MYYSNGGAARAVGAEARGAGTPASDGLFLGGFQKELFLFSCLSPATPVFPLLDIATVMVKGKAVLPAIVLVTIIAEEGEIDPFPADCTVGIERGGFLLLLKFREEPPDFPKDGHYRVSTRGKGD